MGRDFIKRIKNYKFHVRGYFNPFINFQINLLGNYSGVLSLKRDCQLIVSLTSYDERFTELPKTLYSLLNQDLKPDRVILWLDDKYTLIDLPYNISRFIKHGLEVRFVEDIGSYTKVIYAFKEFKDSIIVTADDDIYYPKDWLKKLYLSYIAHPEDIQVHRAHRVNLDLPYEKWEKHVVDESARYDNFLTGVGGVLYPPNCFSKEVLRDDIFLKDCPKADDIWLWVMALLHNKKIRVVKNHNQGLIVSNFYKQLFSKNLYKENIKGGNDLQLRNLLRLYGQNVKNKLR